MPANIYVDGCCIRNGQEDAQAGIGIFAEHPESIRIAEPVRGKATNSEAEIQAATRALKEAYNRDMMDVRILTDSKYVVDASQKHWFGEWAKNGWKGSDGHSLKNKDSLKKLYKAIDKLDRVEWEHVSGHTGVYGNEMADKLARKGAQKYSYD